MHDPRPGSMGSWILYPIRRIRALRAYPGASCFLCVHEIKLYIDIEG
ncbi:Protein of unknown function [Pyronema omphalodes CBS 100304]|uniref:Uncharacterized protein n=1 Tax=Pyronema omphalodes (strain CBS 100304) TaxID=1076935 RepID=U4LQJ5_PYROM|nr:Protein of unknown function [Pyronema omphalodes CBS 100304]